MVGEAFFAHKSHGKRWIQYYYYESVKKITKFKRTFCQIYHHKHGYSYWQQKKLLWHVSLTITAEVCCVCFFYIAITGSIYNLGVVCILPFDFIKIKFYVNCLDIIVPRRFVERVSKVLNIIFNVFYKRIFNIILCNDFFIARQINYFVNYCNYY